MKKFKHLAFAAVITLVASMAIANEAHANDLEQEVNFDQPFEVNISKESKYYNFELEKDGRLVVELDAAGNSWAVLDIVKNRTTVKQERISNINDNKEFSTYTYDLPAGNYTLVFTGSYLNRGHYNVDLDFTTFASDEVQPNNTIDQAQPIKSKQLINGFIDEVNLIDYYKVTLDKPAVVDVEIKGYLDGYTSYKLLDTDMNVIFDKRKDSTYTEFAKINQTTEKLKPGEYFIAVYAEYRYYPRGKSTGKYQLMVDVKNEITNNAITKFKDYKPGLYWTEPFAWGFGKNVINGDKTTMKLNPNNKINESQWLAMLLRYAYDVKDATKGKWHDPYYAKAKQLGLKVSNKPSYNLTRGEVAQMLATIAEGKTMTEREAVLWMFEKGLTTGTNAAAGATYENFNPKGNMTRSHAVTFMYRLFEEQ
ncbi:hypothetical protein [Solibacillus sp. NPDC093137]|uniref:hypothetical protein n=1 Tax=Solibacillus sp. NPDC093137 TaxID=3390678 RepID=UPI003CFEC080